MNRVFGPLEEQQKGISAELEKLSTAVVRDVEHLAENVVENPGEFLSSYSAAPGQIY